jgi:site-specific DNA-methyltransferase (adenine-specific)
MRDLARAGLRADALVSDAPYHLTSIVQRFGKGALDDDTQTSRRMRDRSDGAARLSRGFMGREWDGGDVAQSVP